MPINATDVMNLDNDLDAAITVVGKIEEEQYLFRIEAEAATTEGTRTPTHASVSGGRTPAGLLGSKPSSAGDHVPSLSIATIMAHGPNRS